MLATKGFGSLKSLAIAISAATAGLSQLAFAGGVSIDPVNGSVDEGSPITLMVNVGYGPTASGTIDVDGVGTVYAQFDGPSSFSYDYTPVQDSDFSSVTWSTSGDSDGNSFFASGSFVVNNVAPEITSMTFNGIEYALVAFVYEGDNVDIQMASTDPGADDHTFFIDGSYAGTDSSQSGTRYSSTYSRTFYQNGSYNIDFSVDDDDTTTYASRTLEVINAAPTITEATLNGFDYDQYVFEGDSVLAHFFSTDPGEDVHYFNVTVEGVGSYDAGNDSSLSGTRSSSDVDVTQYQQGSYTVRYDVSDGEETTTQWRTLNVTNAPPSITSAVLNGVDDINPIYVFEGDQVLAQLVSTDPGEDGHSFSVTVNGGPELDGSYDGTTSGTRFSSLVDVTQYQDGSYTVQFGATDDQDTTTTTREFIVFNVAPTITDSPVDSIVDFSVTSVFDFLADGYDPGTLDTLTYFWDLNGDGFYDDFTGASGSFDFASLGLPDGTILNLGVMVTDDDDLDIASFTVQLVNVPEPTSLGLIGAIGMIALRRSRKN